MEEEYSLYYLDHRLRLAKDRTYLIGRGAENDVVLPHLSVSRQHARLTWSEGGFSLTDMGSTNGIVVNGRRLSERQLADGDKIRIGSFNLQFIVRDGTEVEEDQDEIVNSQTLAMERTVAELLQNVQDPRLAAKIMDLKQSFEKKREELSDLAFKDTLTRIYNRRYFDAKIIEEIEAAVSNERPLSLVMIDIDHFKSVNDQHGHQRGDEIVRNVSGIVCEAVRVDDTVARYGGEEIVVILPGVDLRLGMVIAERFRLRVEEKVLLQTGLAVTISLGVAELSDRVNTPERLIYEADRALYFAKQNGRNRVAAAD